MKIFKATLIVFCMSFVPALFADPLPDTPATGSVEEAQQRMKTKLAALPELPKASPKDYFDLKMDSGKVTTHIKLPKKSIELSRLPTDAKNLLTTVVYAPPKASDWGDRIVFKMEVYDFSRPDVVYQKYTVLQTRYALQVAKSTIRNTFEEIDDDESPSEIISLEQYKDELDYVNQPDESSYCERHCEDRDDDGGEINEINVEAKDFTEFRASYADELNQNLRPILRIFGQEENLMEPSPQMAWEVLNPEVKLSEDDIQTFKKAVAACDADDWQVRDTAERSLVDTGPKALLYLSKLSRDTLSPEQLSRVDSANFQLHPVRHDDLFGLQMSPSFLLDCFYSTNADVRNVAVSRWQRTQNFPLSITAESKPDEISVTVAKARDYLMNSERDRDAALAKFGAVIQGVPQLNVLKFFKSE